MNEMYGRIGRWIGIDPRFIKLNGRLYPGGIKMLNISPDTQVISETNRISVVKLELND
jgi:hypothetical protein